MDALRDADERLKLREDHALLVLATHADDVLDLFLVSHATIEHFTR